MHILVFVVKCRHRVLREAHLVRLDVILREPKQALTPKAIDLRSKGRSALAQQVAKQAHELARLTQLRRLLRRELRLPAACTTGETDVGERARRGQQNGLPFGQVILKVLVLLVACGIAVGLVQVSLQVGDDSFQERRRQRYGPAAFGLDRVPDFSGGGTPVVLIEEECPRIARPGPLLRHGGIGERRHVGEPAGQQGTHLAYEPVLQCVGGALRLRKRVLQLVLGVGPAGLVPLHVFIADATALDLDRGHSDAWPERQYVDLVLGPSVTDLDGVRHDDVIGEFPLQNVPDGFLGKLALSEIGGRRNAAPGGSSRRLLALPSIYRRQSTTTHPKTVRGKTLKPLRNPSRNGVRTT